MHSVTFSKPGVTALAMHPCHLSQVKKEMNKTLRSYTWCFFETRATIANIIDQDVIRCFQSRLFFKHTYHDFRRNRPTTAVELCDMMSWWAD
jgi:hypothetical protein